MLNTILGILILGMSVFLVVTILLQSSKDHRMSGTIAGSAETFFGKQKGKTVDAFLNKLTVVICILFFICVIVMYIVQPNAETNANIIDNQIDVSDIEGEVVDGAEDETVTDETVTDETVTDETATDETVTDETVTDETVTDESIAEDNNFSFAE